MEFKEKIKKRRLQLGMTLKEVAKIAGVSAPTIQRYESGEIKNLRTDKIKLLAAALKVTPSYLMDLEKKAELKKDNFRYFLEMQLALLGYKLEIDEDNMSIFLTGKEGVYEIKDSDFESICDKVKSFLDFQIYDLMQKSRKITD